MLREIFSENWISDAVYLLNFQSIHALLDLTLDPFTECFSKLGGGVELKLAKGGENGSVDCQLLLRGLACELAVFQVWQFTLLLSLALI